MEGIVGKDITIKDPTKELLAWAKTELIIDNPEYIQKKRMGL